MGNGRARPEVGEQDYFLRGWKTYRKVLDRDYMHHGAVYDVLRRVVQDEAAPRFAFLDIACGDAAASARALRGTDIGSYHGVDISRPALVIARDELAVLGCPVSLIEGDLRAALADWRTPVDVAWIGQSLHHWLAAGKRQVMRDVRRVLAPGGVFLIWEPTTLPDEDGDGWLARLAALRPVWADLDADEWKTMFEHCRVADRQETAERWLSLGREAGFATAREIYAAPNGLARIYLFRD